MDNIDAQIAEAIYDDDVETTRQLLTQYPEHIPGSHGGHPWLQLAARCQNLVMVKMLLELGCDVNAEEDYPERMTALDSALARDDVAIVRLLLEHGANPNQGRQIITAITGNKTRSLELVKLLEEFGGDLNRVFTNEINNQPMNAVSTAMEWRQEDVVNYLRSRGCGLPACFWPIESLTCNLPCSVHMKSR